MSAYLLVTFVAALGSTSHFEQGLVAYDAGQFDRARSAFTAALDDGVVPTGSTSVNDESALVTATSSDEAAEELRVAREELRENARKMEDMARELREKDAVIAEKRMQ